MYGNTSQQPPLGGDILGAGHAKASSKRPSWLYLALDHLTSRIVTLESALDMLERDLRPVLRPTAVAKQIESTVAPPPQPGGEVVQQIRGLCNHLERVQERILQMGSSLDTVAEDDGPY